jgi:amino-acid N-acetyltransferase
MIRTATARDWSAIERLLTDSGLPLDGARDHISRFIVAEENGAIAGCAALERYGEIAPSDSETGSSLFSC